MIHGESERKILEILRILKDSGEPIGAKRLSELMADRGYVLTDRAVQYYLSYLDRRGFTRKIGNTGRVLTPRGAAEMERALVEERVGFIISELERLAYRSTFDPSSATGDVAFNLTLVPETEGEAVADAFEEVIKAGYGFFSGFRQLDRDPRVPRGYTGFITVCSITMDGALQRRGVPVRVAYGGRISVEGGKASGFLDLIDYRGTTIDPLQLFISAGLTSIGRAISEGTGIALANVRKIPVLAREETRRTIELMQDCGFSFPVAVGVDPFNLPSDPYRLSIIAFSGMNCAAHAVEEGFTVRTVIGAGTIPFSRLVASSEST